MQNGFGLQASDKWGEKPLRIEVEMPEEMNEEPTK